MSQHHPAGVGVAGISVVPSPHLGFRSTQEVANMRNDPVVVQRSQFELDEAAEQSRGDGGHVTPNA
jgi:hypothetical protein